MNAKECIDFHVEQIIKRGIKRTKVFLCESYFEELYGTELEKVRIIVGEVPLPDVCVEVIKTRSV